MGSIRRFDRLLLAGNVCARILVWRQNNSGRQGHIRSRHDLLLGLSLCRHVPPAGCPPAYHNDKRQNSIASLLTVIQDDASRSVSGNNPFSPTDSPIDSSFSAAVGKLNPKRVSRPLTLGGVRPCRCHGEFNFNHISFAYPSRPENPVLCDISLFIPPGETTFIVGGSGSGKSTIAQLLLRLYDPTSGEITMDNQSFPFLNSHFTRENIAAVQQGCILSICRCMTMSLWGLVGLVPIPRRESRGHQKT